MSGFVFGKERYIKQKFNVGWFSEHVPVFSVRWIDYRQRDFAAFACIFSYPFFACMTSFAVLLTEKIRFKFNINNNFDEFE